MKKFRVPVDGDLIIEAENKEEAYKKVETLGEYGDTVMVAASTDIIDEVK